MSANCLLESLLASATAFTSCQMARTRLLLVSGGACLGVVVAWVGWSWLGMCCVVLAMGLGWMWRRGPAFEDIFERESGLSYTVTRLTLEERSKLSDAGMGRLEAFFAKHPTVPQREKARKLNRATLVIGAVACALVLLLGWLDRRANQTASAETPYDPDIPLLTQVLSETDENQTHLDPEQTAELATELIHRTEPHVKKAIQALTTAEEAIRQADTGDANHSREAASKMQAANEALNRIASDKRVAQAIRDQADRMQEKLGQSSRTYERLAGEDAAKRRAELGRESGPLREQIGEMRKALEKADEQNQKFLDVVYGQDSGRSSKLKQAVEKTRQCNCSGSGGGGKETIAEIRRRTTQELKEAPIVVRGAPTGQAGNKTGTSETKLVQTGTQVEPDHPESKPDPGQLRKGNVAGGKSSQKVRDSGAGLSALGSSVE